MPKWDSQPCRCSGQWRAGLSAQIKFALLYQLGGQVSQHVAAIIEAKSAASAGVRRGLPAAWPIRARSSRPTAEMQAWPTGRRGRHRLAARRNRPVARVGCHGLPRRAEHGRRRLLGQRAAGRQLAADERDQRHARRVVPDELVPARDRRRRFGIDIRQRADAALVHRDVAALSGRHREKRRQRPPAGTPVPARSPPRLAGSPSNGMSVVPTSVPSPNGSRNTGRPSRASV